MLPSYAFPHHVLGDDDLKAALADERLDRIRDSVRKQNEPLPTAITAPAGPTIRR